MDKRFGRHYILVDPSDCDPPHGLDLSPGSRDTLKVEMLAEAFAKDGFDPNYPALVAYPKNGKIQLLSGTHRHEAARRAGIRLPVTMHLRSIVEATWGTDNWNGVISDIPVKDLECMEILPSEAAALADRIDLDNYMEDTNV